MARAARQTHSSSVRTGGSGTGRHGAFQGRRQTDPDGRSATIRALGFCGWAVAGAVAAFAIWEFGNFRVLIGNAPLLPAAVRDTAPSGVFRPAGGSTEEDGGCTQAPIDRASGQTTPTDCHTWATGFETRTAGLYGALRTAVPKKDRAPRGARQEAVLSKRQ
jgi:hypothetical protein